MEPASPQEIRRLLKTFGIAVDEAIAAHRLHHAGPLKLRLTMEDRTDYGASPPAERLHFELEGEIGAA